MTSSRDILSSKKIFSDVFTTCQRLYVPIFRLIELSTQGLWRGAPCAPPPRGFIRPKKPGVSRVKNLILGGDTTEKRYFLTWDKISLIFVPGTMAQN